MVVFRSYTPIGSSVSSPVRMTHINTRKCIGLVCSNSSVWTIIKLYTNVERYYGNKLYKNPKTMTKSSSRQFQDSP